MVGTAARLCSLISSSLQERSGTNHEVLNIPLQEKRFAQCDKICTGDLGGERFPGTSKFVHYTQSNVMLDVY